MPRGWCEHCETEYDGERCPVCGGILLREIDEQSADPWLDSASGSGSGDLPWPLNGSGEPEDPVLLTQITDLGGRCALLLSRLRAYSIPSLIRYPGADAMVRIIFGFSGNGAQIFVPASRLEEACKLLDLF